MMNGDTVHVWGLQGSERLGTHCRPCELGITLDRRYGICQDIKMDGGYLLRVQRMKHNLAQLLGGCCSAD